MGVAGWQSGRDGSVQFEVVRRPDIPTAQEFLALLDALPGQGTPDGNDLRDHRASHLRASRNRVSRIKRGRYAVLRSA